MWRPARRARRSRRQSDCEQLPTPSVGTRNPGCADHRGLIGQTCGRRPPTPGRPGTKRHQRPLDAVTVWSSPLCGCGPDGQHSRPRRHPQPPMRFDRQTVVRSARNRPDHNRCSNADARKPAARSTASALDVADRPCCRRPPPSLRGGDRRRGGHAPVAGQELVHRPTKPPAPLHTSCRQPRDSNTAVAHLNVAVTFGSPIRSAGFTFTTVIAPGPSIRRNPGHTPQLPCDGGLHQNAATTTDWCAKSQAGDGPVPGGSHKPRGPRSWWTNTTRSNVPTAMPAELRQGATSPPDNTSNAPTGRAPPRTGHRPPQDSTEAGLPGSCR